MEIDSSLRFSPSKLDVYRCCPRRYRYRYVDRIHRDYETVEAFMGQCVHSALESFYRALMSGKTLPASEVQAEFDKEWEKGWSEDIVVHDKRIAPGDWKNAGRECLASYYEAHRPFNEDRTIDVERKVAFPLEVSGRECRIEGYVDRLASSSDGTWIIHDYKTGRSLPSSRDLAEEWQLPIYEMALRHMWPEAEKVRLVWHYLRAGKDLTEHKGERELEELRGRVAALIGEIKADREFAPRKSALCDWCEYRDICPLWSHAERLSRMPAGKVRSEDGVKLVARLAALDAGKKELRQEIKEIEKDEEAVEEALLDYADANGVSVVTGLEGRASITEKEEYQLPSKTHSPEDCEAFEKALKDAPFWKEVSHLDGHALMELYRSRGLADDQMRLVSALLSRYAKLRKIRSVRFSRKKECDDPV